MDVDRILNCIVKSESINDKQLLTVLIVCFAVEDLSRRWYDLLGGGGERLIFYLGKRHKNLTSDVILLWIKKCQPEP